MPSGMPHGETLGRRRPAGVAALGRLAVVARAVVGQDGALGAELLLAVLAVLALAARVDHAADADAVADLVPRHAVADRGDDAGDLVARDHAGRWRSPHSSRTWWMSLWQMPAKADVDEDVVVAQVAALDGRASNGGSGARCDQGGGGNRECLLRWWRRSPVQRSLTPSHSPPTGPSNACAGQSLGSSDVATSR